MRRRNKFGDLSSYLVARGVIIGCFVLALVCNWAQFSALSAFLLLLGLLGLAARLWGFSALKRVEVKLDAGHRRMFAGASVPVRYQIKNDKLLPLFWLEYCQEVPPGGCMVPDGTFERREAEPQGKGEVGKSLYRRRLAFLMWYQTVSWDTVWTARRRGIYQIREVLLRSGDGFGLAQSLCTREIPGAPAFVVYPKLVPVHTEDFFRNVWSGQTGARGYLEDITVLRGVRDYQERDSWKRIDWRMAARQEDLQVKQFDTVQPRSIHFIVDCRSFTGSSPENEELEEMFSVLASLLLRLDGQGVSCGLSLPGTAKSASVDLFPDDRSVGVQDLLFQISAFDAESATNVFGQRLIAGMQSRVGQTYFVTWGGGKTECEALLKRLNRGALQVISRVPAAEGDADLLAGCRTLLLDGLKGGGGT
jgi:uncharacterized protein (DUF58 family)